MKRGKRVHLHWHDVICLVLSLVGIIALTFGIKYYDKQQKLVASQFEEVSKEIHGEEKEIIKRKTAVKDSLPTVKCWGGGLTSGVGGIGVTYPGVLKELSGLKVKNYGVEGNSLDEIGLRMGLYELEVNEFQIPDMLITTQIELTSGGEELTFIQNGDAGLNPCVINGITGSITYNPNKKGYYFTRKRAGNVVPVEAGSIVQTNTSLDMMESDIYIYLLEMDEFDKKTIEELISIQEEMIDYISSERYIIVALTSLEKSEILKDKFGNHFLDLRSVLTRELFENAGISMSDKELQELEKGIIPESIGSDGRYGTADFYRLIAQVVYNKIIELNYLSQEQLDYLEHN